MLLRVLNGNSDVDGRITGVAVLDLRMTGEAVEGVPVIADRDSVLEYAVRGVVDEVFIHVSDLKSQEKYFKHLVLELEKMGIVVNLNWETIVRNESIVWGIIMWRLL